MKMNQNGAVNLLNAHLSALGVSFSVSQFLQILTVVSSSVTALEGIVDGPTVQVASPVVAPTPAIAPTPAAPVVAPAPAIAPTPAAPVPAPVPAPVVAPAAPALAIAKS